MQFDLDDCRRWEFMLPTDESVTSMLAKRTSERFDDDGDDKVREVIWYHHVIHASLHNADDDDDDDDHICKL